MTDTIHLGLPYIESAQAQKHVTHNEALRVLDALVMLSVLDRDLSSPPPAPAEGDRYLVKSPGADAFAGMDDRIAHFVDGGWTFHAPSAGWLCYVADESVLVAWDGDSWEQIVGGGGGGEITELQNLDLLGVGTIADATNPFSAKLNNALWTALTDAEGGDGNLRYKMSKESAADTLSLLMQTNFSARAEIGLTGDDDLHVKVSPDGSTWYDAIVVDRATGEVSFPQNPPASLAGDIELTVALNTCAAARANGVAQFLGTRFADSFDALDYVDDAASINLDTGIAGLLKPSTQGSGAALTASAINPADQSSYTFTGLAIGAADADRSVVAAAYARRIGGGSISSVTIGGVAATQLVSAGTGESTTGLYLAALPSGTTADVVVTLNDVANRCGVHVYRLVGINPTPIDTALSASDPADLTIDASAGGIILGIAGQVSTAGIDWTGIAEQQEDIVEGVAAMSSAMLSPGATQAGYAVAADFISALHTSAVAVSFEPAAASVGNMTALSEAISVPAVPDAVTVVARVKHVDSATPGTDYDFYVSRDGGATFSAALTPNDRFTDPSDGAHVIECNPMDVAGQPSGTSIVLKMVTANNKMVELRDWYFRGA
jgi:hypothetical protein